MTKAVLPIAALLLACALPAQAAGGVWRCAGNSYSDAPCAEGRVLALADEARPAADVAAARAVAAREQRLADALRDERLEREAANRPPQPARAKAAARRSAALPAGQTARKAGRQRDEAGVRPTAAAKKPGRLPAGADTFRAVAPASR